MKEVEKRKGTKTTLKVFTKVLHKIPIRYLLIGE